ncbi:hypothetical protein CQW23_03455 [Capsicum baccatum]|uniref:Ycf2 N-terminal domain-containing protein n=1 Tax=Capsicum baccatum TaxID=33114 RepID=A0A2G2XBZ1_CAPBA|nr:hypothetical protein CQW23_03455 [Capsicum baccatum]
MIPTLLTTTSVFIIAFIATPPVDIDGIREPISGSLLYGNNIISGAIIPTSAAIGLHFYPIWEAEFVDEWLYNGGPYELIVLHFLLGVAYYMGREWELSFRLGMRPWITVAYSAPVAAATAFFLIYPIGQGSFSDGISWRILQKKLCLPQWNLISEISSKCLHNLLFSEEMIHRNNESPLISTHLRSPNAREFLYSIIFLLLVAGYLIHTYLLFVSRAFSELQTEFERVKSLMIPSSMIELRKLLDRYPTSELNSFWLKNLFLVALEQLGDSLEEIWGSASGGNMLGPAYGVKSIRSKKKDWNINLIEIIDLIPNPINRITFSRNTRHLSHTSSLFDFDRYGLVPTSSPRQADLILTAGIVTMKMAPFSVRLYEQMPEPKYVIAMGACTITGGMFSTDSYSTVRGVDKLIPVDVYLPGCQPKAEAVIDAITKHHKKISQELYEDRIRSQRVNRCFTANHKFHVRCSIHTGNYDQRVLYQPPSTSEIPTKIFSKYKNSVSSPELVN